MRRRSLIPTSRRGRLFAGGGALLAVGGVGLIAAYTLVFSGSSAAPLSIEAASAPSGTALPASQSSGTWKVAAGSVAGYRVHEKLAFLSASSDAVGRTSSVTGSMTLASAGSGFSVTAAQLSVDVSSLTSDKSMRDSRIHTMGLESDRYPTATFQLSQPIAVPAGADNGAVQQLSATGALTIHGTTRTVTIPITARLAGAQLEIAGSITFPFEQFGMQVPSLLGFVTVEDHATMEFDVRFQKQ